MDKLAERVSIMEKRAEHLEHRITVMEKNHEALQELKTSVEILALTNENQNKQIELQNEQFLATNETMKSINENLTNLNHSHDKLHADFSRIDNRVKKVEAIQEDSKIHIGSLVKTVLISFLTGLGTFALGYLAFLFGGQ